MIDAEDGVRDLAELSPTLDQRGLVRFRLPEGVYGDTATLEILALRDAHGRPYRDLPLRISFANVR